MQKLPSNHTFLEPWDQVLSSSRSRLGKYLQINCSLTFLTIVKTTKWLTQLTRDISIVGDSIKWSYEILLVLFYRTLALTTKLFIGYWQWPHRHFVDTWPQTLIWHMTFAMENSLFIAYNIHGNKWTIYLTTFISLDVWYL